MLLRRYAWIAVPALAIAELVSHQYFSTRAPRPADYEQLTPAIATLRRNAEPVVVAPRWAEPLVRSALGDSLMPVSDIGRPDESAYPRAIEVAVLGQSASELSSWRTTKSERVGPFEVRVRENPKPAAPTYRFVDAVDSGRAAVFDDADAERSPCRYDRRARAKAGNLPDPPAFPKERYACVGGEPFFVGATVIDDPEYRPRRCIWAHPPERGARIIEFENVPLGGSIYGYTGVPWLILRDGLGPPVELTVSIDDREIGRVLHADTDGWRKFVLATGKAGARGRVTFRVASSSAANRQFCFYADSR